MKRLEDKHLKTIKEWRSCPMSNYVCTVTNYTQNEANTPRGLALLSMLIQKGTRDFSEDNVNKFYQCSLSGLCSDQGFDETDIPELVRAMRAEIVDAGEAPENAYKVRDQIMDARPLVNEADAGEIEELPVQYEDSDLLFLSTPWYTPIHTNVATASLQLFQKTSLSINTLEKGMEAGSLLFELGFWDEAKAKGNQLISEIKKRSITKVISPCPHQLFAIQKYFGELGLELPSELKLEPLTQTILKLLKKDSLTLDINLDTEVAVHEACLLARDLEFVNTGEELQEHLLEGDAVDLRWSGAETRCCGGSTPQFIFPELAKKVTDTNLSDMVAGQEQRLDKLVTTCPYCQRAFDSVNPDFEIIDFPSFVLKHAS